MSSSASGGSSTPPLGGNVYVPISADDLLRLREQIRADDLERSRTAALNYVEQVAEARTNAQSYSKEHGLAAIRSVFLLNGGAILALLTFLGSLYTKDVAIAGLLSRKVLPAFQFFIGGLVAATVTTTIGYLNWTWVVESWLDPTDAYRWLRREQTEVSPWVNRKLTWSLVAAITIGVGSLLLFIRGTWIVARAFAKIAIATGVGTPG